MARLRRWVVPVVVVAGVVAASCSSGPRPTKTSRPASTTTQASTTIIRSVHQVDWRNATIPAAACGTKGDVTLKDEYGGEQAVPAGVDFEFVNLGRPIRYLDLGNNGTDDAAVPIDCVGAMSRSVVVVFTLRGSSLAVLGILTTTQPNPPDRPPFIDNAASAFAPDHIEAVEMWYQPSDGQFCCPSIVARTTWTYQGGALHRGVTSTTPRALPHVTPDDFVRKWHIHDGQLDISSTHEAIESGRAGTCEGSDACYEERHLRLSASADGQALTGTIVGETYLSGDQRPVPRPPDQTSSIGEVYRFEIVYPSILRETPVRVPTEHSPADDAYFFCGPDLHPWQIAYTCN